MFTPLSQPALKTQSNLNFPELSFQNILCHNQQYPTELNTNYSVAFLKRLIKLIRFPTAFHSHIWESALFEVTDGEDWTNEAAEDHCTTEIHVRMDSLLLVLLKSTSERLLKVA